MGTVARTGKGWSIQCWTPYGISLSFRGSSPNGIICCLPRCIRRERYGKQSSQDSNRSYWKAELEKGRGSETDREREVFHLLLNAPNDHNGQIHSPGASSKHPTWVHEPKHLANLPLLFRSISGTWVENGATGLELLLLGGCWHYR